MIRGWLEGFCDVPPLAPDERSGAAIRQILDDVCDLGYYVVFGVLDSADYGAPQHRLRFIMLGSRDRPAPALPKPTHGLSELNLEPFHTVRQAIAHLQDDPGTGSQYTPPMRQLFAMVPPGGNWRSLPPELQPEALGGAWSSGGGKTGFYRRLPWDAPSPTITCRANRKGSALCHPEAVRPVSVRECAILQGFPEDWQFYGSMNAPIHADRECRSDPAGESHCRLAPAAQARQAESEESKRRLRRHAERRNNPAPGVRPQQAETCREEGCMSTPPSRLRFVSDQNPIHRVNEDIYDRLVRAQGNIIEKAFSDAAAFYAKVFDDLKLSLVIPDGLGGTPVRDVTDRPFGALVQQQFLPVLETAGIAGTAARIHAVNLAQRAHLVRAFDQPDIVLGDVTEKVEKIIKNLSSYRKGH